MLYYLKYGERSQVVKAADCGSAIRGFESHRSPLFEAQQSFQGTDKSRSKKMRFNLLNGYGILTIILPNGVILDDSDENSENI
jgi:hypothetical protein